MAISQLGLSGYVFPLAVPWQGCSKESVLPLHSCACTHLRICSGRPTRDCAVCQEALSRKKEMPTTFLLQTIYASSSHCSLNSFAWMRMVVFTQLGSQHPFLFLSGGTGFCSGTGGWSPPVWLCPKCRSRKPRPLLSWGWRELQGQVLKCRSWQLTAWAQQVYLQPLFHMPWQRCRGV